MLVSTTAGIEDPAERARRRASDDRLADGLESAPFEDYIARWAAQPLFAEDPPEVGELARADQRRNRPDELAAVLRGIGTGEMEPLWSRLGELKMPVTLLVGDRDRKFQGRSPGGWLPGGLAWRAAGSSPVVTGCSSRTRRPSPVR